MVVLMLALLATQPLTPHEELEGGNTLVSMLENKNEWKEDDRLAAVALVDRVKRDWATCAHEAVMKLKAAREPADTVVTAAFGECLDFEHLYRRSAALSLRGLLPPGDRDDRAEGAAELLKQEMREMLTGQLLTARVSER